MNFESFRQNIKDIESSGGNYLAYNNNSGASGAYGYIQDTWDYWVKQIGHSEYAGKNATYAPPQIQDAVFDANMRYLAKKYNNDYRYMAVAHYGGEGTADREYQRGYFSTVQEAGGYPSIDEYVRKATKGYGGFPQDNRNNNNFSNRQVDRNYVNVWESTAGATDLDNLTPQSKLGVNELAYRFFQSYGHKITITGGAEKGYHAKSSTGNGHEDGVKVDVSYDGIEPNKPMGKAFKELCRSLGFSCVEEDGHYDITITGRDSRDPQSGYNLTGGFFSTMAGGIADPTGYNLFRTLETAPHSQFDYLKPKVHEELSTWEKFITGFEYGLTTTGVADLGSLMWGRLYNNGLKSMPSQELTQEDVDYVVSALPDDKEAQAFCLVNGRDKAEIQYLVSQKQKDKAREQLVAEYSEGAIMSWANAGAVIGGLIDPTMLVPLTASLGVAKATQKAGSMIYNTAKLSKLARAGATLGHIAKSDVARIGGGAMLGMASEDAMRATFGGNFKAPQEYALDVALAGITGMTLAGLGKGLTTALSQRNKGLVKTLEVTDSVETSAYKRILDMPESEQQRIRNETIGEAKKYHNADYKDTVKSKAYDTLDDNGRVVAMTSEDAKALFKKYNKDDIGDSVKALRVPNEDYVILLTDRLKPKEVDNVLMHEFVGHNGLKTTMGDKAYDDLLAYVEREADNPSTIWHEARKLSNSYDGEEILAYAIEHNKIPEGETVLSKVKKAINGTLSQKGFKAHLSKKDIKDIMKGELNKQRGADSDFHVAFNPDGSTAFAGLHFSENNVFNPLNVRGWATDSEVNAVNQLGNSPFLRQMSRWVENGYVGTFYNSNSNTLRNFIHNLLDDPRGRGLGKSLTTELPAELHKLQIEQQLNHAIIPYLNTRAGWLLKNKHIINPHSGARLFDKYVTEVYNAKYCYRRVVPDDVPEEVLQAVEHLHNFRDKQIEIGKNSSRMVGSTKSNMVEDDWYAIDNELWRVVDNNARHSFINQFNTLEEAQEFLTEYYNKYADRDVIRAKLERANKKYNAKVKEHNAELKANGSKRKPLEERGEVTDADIDEYLDAKIPGAVKFALTGQQDETLIDSGQIALGRLNSFKDRIPLDTSGVLQMPNGKQFSFDNNLRSYDLDQIIFKNINRFSGESAIKAKFGDPKEFKAFVDNVETELKDALQAGAVDDLKQLDLFQEMIRELRGFRPKNEELGRFSLIARLMGKYSYMQNGTNMGFAQLGEVGGAMAYGGLSQLFRLFAPMGKLMERIKHGKVSAQLLQDAEEYMYGSQLQSQIFTHSYADTVTRNNLTSNNILDRSLKASGDILQNLGKVTSGLNMLPKMTDSMIRGVRIQTLMDSIKWANGYKMSVIRNPFSSAKMQAIGLKPQDCEKLKDVIRKYTQLDQQGKLKGLDVQKFQQEEPLMYSKWYEMIQKQADRAIVAGERMGNRNHFKDMNAFTRLLFQFKDYSLRAVNSQTMRSLTARELDDALATSWSMLSNAGAYALKIYAMYQAYKLAGSTEQAERYKDIMLHSDNIIRAGIFRPAIASGASLVNDFGEALAIQGFNNGTIRTTVKTNMYGQPKNLQERVGRVVAQMPAFQASLGNMQKVYDYVDSVANDTTTKSDFRKMLQVIPFSNWIPFNVFVNSVSENAELPDKKKKKGE